MCRYVSVSVTISWAKAAWEGKDLFHLLTLRSHSITKGSQGGTRGTELEAVTKAEATEECCLLACWICFLIPSRTTCPVMATPPVTWALSHQSLIQKFAPQTCLLTSVVEAFSQGFIFPNVSRFVLTWQKPTSIVCIFLYFSLYKWWMYIYIHM